MEWVGFVRRSAWRNARFGSIRKIWWHIRTTEPRYDPTVFPMEDDTGALVDVEEEEDQSIDPSTQRENSVAMYRALYLSGKLTPLDVAHAILPLIRRDTQPPGEHSVAWIEIQVARVLRAAEASTARYKRQQSLGPLDGVPTAVKDEFDLDGYKTTLGTPNNYAHEHPPPANDETSKDSWCAKKLEEAGALMLGKLSLHEFGMGKSLHPKNAYVII